MDVGKRLAEGANIASAAIAIYLLLKPTGIPSTTGQAVNQVPVHAPVDMRLAVLCVVVFCASVLNFIALRRKPETIPSATPPEKPTSHSSDNQTAVVPTAEDFAPSQFGSAQTVLPDGRVIISCVPEDIAAAYKTKTTDQFNRALGGKWVKMSGQIADNHGSGVVYLEFSRYPSMRLRFEKGWAESLAELSRGASVTVRGKIAGVNGMTVMFDECELL